MADDHEEVTVPAATSATAELDTVAEVLRALWHELKKTEGHIREMVEKAGQGKPLRLDVVASHMRATGDLLTDRASKLHEVARKFEPRKGRKTPQQ